MPWGRLDDSLYDHPKLDRIPVEDRLAAIGLWARAISWCNRFLTDGHVPRSRVGKLDGTPALANALVGAGLFDEVPDGYQVHDFLEFNDSRADVNERRDKEAKRKAEWRASKKAEPRPAGTDAGTSHPVALPGGRPPRSRPGGTPSGTRNGGAPHVPPSVPPSVPAGQDAVSRRDSRARDVARIPARPGPAHSKKSPSPLGTRDPAGEGPLLSRDELEAWSGFGDEWSAFRAAWHERGFRLPPMGDPDEEGSQRNVLYPIVRDWPSEVAAWIRSAPRRAAAADVVGHVIACYREAVAAVPADDVAGFFAEPTRAEAAEALGSIVGRVTGR